jgi:hypothetical protein
MRIAEGVRNVGNIHKISDLLDVFNPELLFSCDRLSRAALGSFSDGSGFMLCFAKRKQRLKGSLLGVA